MILIGSTVGLLATTLSRLYASAWYALQEAKRPMRYAVLRVALTIVLGYLAAIHMPRLLGIPASWGAVGLTASAGVAGWLEFALLRRSLHARIGAAELSSAYILRLWGAGAVGALAGWGMQLLVRQQLGPVLSAVLVLGAFGSAYLAVTWALRIEAARDLVGRLRLAA
jgi:putative peptidoglycan lipid II flippase